MKQRSLFQSFSYALAGFVYALRAERNMKIHIIAAAAAALLGIWVRLSMIEYIFLALTIAMVLIAELLNTCIEVAIDHTTNGEKHPTVKIIKDIGAAAVLTASIAASIIALLLFVPKLFV
ncbi:MAG: diacylglycerol kinase family protein [Candidatus Omnitrophica bacterium]|nr:diacylglycerol kinase family protein [Candidatus Omnitrophota bacterium]